MQIAVFGKRFDPSYDRSIAFLLNELIDRGYDLIFDEDLVRFLKKRELFPPHKHEVFPAGEPLAGVDLLISIGGDGTLLDTLTIVRDSGIPVLGVNTGRLGFLSNIACDKIGDALDAFENEAYTIDERSLIHVDVKDVLNGAFPYALNEVTIHKKDDASMVTVNAAMDGIFINKYWADGLIVSTPTGSTAYSLSCGGPIVMPGSKNLILTPIAPHNLNVRPLVVPNDSTIRLSASGRAPGYLLTIDSQSFELPPDHEVALRTAPFTMRLVNLEGQHFFQTIRNKMLWGLDKRN